MHIYLVCGRRLFQQCDTGHTWSWKFSLLPLSFQAVPLQMMPFSSTTFCGFSTLYIFHGERKFWLVILCKKERTKVTHFFEAAVGEEKKERGVPNTPYNSLYTWRWTNGWLLLYFAKFLLVILLQICNWTVRIRTLPCSVQWNTYSILVMLGLGMNKNTLNSLNQG